ncbi:MAG: argininosuccinate lyase [Chloroflexi bacterium]|nr:argininosuccinate lyase [Chloroflexota bacterium]
MVDSAKTFPHPLYEQYVLQPFYRDAEQYYYEPMLVANRTHVVMLAKCGIISHENARALLTALAQVEADGLDELRYQSGVEDLFFAMERKIIALVGAEHGGNLQLARSRNDLGYALTRLAIRPRLLQVIEYLLQLRTVLIAFARKHLETLMPGYTHTQPAQPTTMAHYIAGVLAFQERDMQRLQFAHRINNQSPLGAAALTGTGFPIDRHLSARLLGFDRPMASTYDSIGASDNLTDVAHAITSIGVNLSRFTKDMLFWATRESGAIRIDDSFIQISSIMPQKRNPVVLEHLRARISRMIAQAHGVVIQCHNIPYGDTQDIEDEIFPFVFGSMETAIEVLHLYRAVIETLHVNVDYLRQRAIAGFTTVTELADTLVREANLSFRQAHSIVSQMVSYSLEKNLTPTDFDNVLLAQVSESKIGQRISMPDAMIQRALDPAAFVALRNLPGGAAPESTAKVLDEQQAQLTMDFQWLSSVRATLSRANEALQHEVQAILQ